MSPHKPRESSKAEKIVFSIYVHGPQVIFDHLKELRDMYHANRDAFSEIKMALWEDGMELDEIMDLVALSGRHGDDCVCWRCIDRTMSAIRRCEAKMQVDAEMRRSAATQSPSLVSDDCPDMWVDEEVAP